MLLPVYEEGDIIKNSIILQKRLRPKISKAESMKINAKNVNIKKYRN